MRNDHAGLYIMKAALQLIGFDDAVSTMQITWDGRFSGLECTYTLIWMVLNKIDAPYLLNEIDCTNLAQFLGKEKSPLKDDIYSFYKAIDLDNAEQFINGLARCYYDAGIVTGIVILFDDHGIPYFGTVPIGIIHHTIRNKNMPGIKLSQINDFNGNFILFKLTDADSSYFDVATELVLRVKRVLGEDKAQVLIVDREGVSLPFLLRLDAQGIRFIVLIKQTSTTVTAMNKIPEHAFKIPYDDDEYIIDTKMRLKWKKWRAGIILNKKDQSRYGFYTNIPKTEEKNIATIGHKYPFRWRQESKFEEGKNHAGIDKFANYTFIVAPNIRLKQKKEELEKKLSTYTSWLENKNQEIAKRKEQYAKKERVFNDRKNENERITKNFELRLTTTKNKAKILERLDRKRAERDCINQNYLAALSAIKNTIAELKKKRAEYEQRLATLQTEIEEIASDAEFFRFNFAATTYSIGVKEALVNVNWLITSHLLPVHRFMKLNRAIQTIYHLSGFEYSDSTHKYVILNLIRKKSLKLGVQLICEWLNSCNILDEFCRIYHFSVVDVEEHANEIVDVIPLIDVLNFSAPPLELLASNA